MAPRHDGEGGGAVRGESAAPALNRGAITISIMLAPIMQGVDTTIANVALPHMQGSLSAAQDQIAWVLTSYIVAAAIMMPLTGWLASRRQSAFTRTKPPGTATRPPRSTGYTVRCAIRAREALRGDDAMPD